MAVIVKFFCAECKKVKEEQVPTGVHPTICQECEAQKEQEKKDRYKEETKNMSEEELRVRVAELSYMLHEVILPQLNEIRIKNTVF